MGNLAMKILPVPAKRVRGKRLTGKRGCGNACGTPRMLDFDSLLTAHQFTGFPLQLSPRSFHFMDCNSRPNINPWMQVQLLMALPSSSEESDQNASTDPPAKAIAAIHMAMIKANSTASTAD